LISRSGDIGVHVVPANRGTPIRPLQRGLARSGWPQYMLAMAAASAVAAAGFVLTPLVGAQATALSALLAIVVLALFVERGPVLLAAAMIAAIWDYFFFAPVFAFRIAHVEDALLLGMYFVVALALGQLTARIRAQEVAERQREGRATTLYLLGRELAEATTLHQIIHKVVAEMRQCFDAEAAVLLLDASARLQAQIGSSLAIGEKEQAIAAWVLEHRKPAGKFTDNLPVAEAMFVPLESGHSTIGVLGLRLRQAAPPTIHQRNLLDALTRQIALALDRQRLSELSEKARLVAESERLGKTLLDSMSHEIRTPLAGIKAAVTDLAALGLVNAQGEELIAEIQEATQRLNRLVGKVLDITRLESGHVTPLFNECDVYEIVNLAVEETEKDLAGRPFSLDMDRGLPIIRTDFVFVQQALMNLLSNAAVHTPAGTAVHVRVRQDGEALIFEVADRGPGIDPQSLPRVFDKFYRGAAAPTGGTGLGLSLVKGFVEALGGKVKAENRAGGGAVFTIMLQSTRAEHRETVSF
jgi:two-component system, OmpR family, sensor histidine kinase KdpD